MLQYKNNDEEDYTFSNILDLPGTCILLLLLFFSKELFDSIPDD